MVVEKARVARLKPNQLVRLATMAFVDTDLLSIHERVCTIERDLAVFREEQSRRLNALEELFRNRRWKT